MSQETQEIQPTPSTPGLTALAATLESKIATLPDAPGVYLHKDSNGKVIYIGKARSLKSRVRTYFLKDAGHSPFHRKMARIIADFDTVVTRNEKEALILENNLVKMHKPH